MSLFKEVVINIKFAYSNWDIMYTYNINNIECKCWTYYFEDIVVERSIWSNMEGPHVELHPMSSF
jgi:hypothetical protein